ncbi:MAG: hypothetical protein A2Y41_09100 [Spirochaetes bacterium GWB1_36_13]|nr:MAG: hypothetical protein A2Y41_09100 [Spirochaetes bacterium GWB1_36_13]
MRILKVFMLAVFVLTAAGHVNQADAASWKGWKWDAFKIKFQLPSNLFVTEASKTRLVATDKREFTMTVAPWKDATLTQKDVANRGFNNYTAISNKERIEEGDMGDFNGFKGYYIYAFGQSSGKDLYFVVVGLIDPYSPINFYVTFAWWDKAQNNNKFENLSYQISKTFAKK